MKSWRTIFAWEVVEFQPGETVRVINSEYEEFGVYAGAAGVVTGVKYLSTGTPYLEVTFTDSGKGLNVFPTDVERI